MTHDDMYDIPALCPVTGQTMHVSELESGDGEITIRGRFRVPDTARLAPEQHDFLVAFLRARGVISTLEKELGLSYPTARARLDALLEAMGLTAYRETRTAREGRDAAEAKRRILEELEQGSITADEAKTRLKEADTK